MKKIVSKLLVLLLIMSIIPYSGVSAKSNKKTSSEKAVMDGLNISWDLKKGKTLDVKTNFYLTGEHKYKVKMTQYNVTQTKNGMKKVTFKLRYTGRAPEMTKKQSRKWENSVIYGSEAPGGGSYFSVLDYKTGLSLERENDLGVKVKKIYSKYSKKKLYFTSSVPDSYDKKKPYEESYDDEILEDWFENYDYVWIADMYEVKVSVTFPADYEDLVILAGGIKNYKEDYADFWNGKIKFTDTDLYVKNDKLYCHALRVK